MLLGGILLYALLALTAGIPLGILVYHRVITWLGWDRGFQLYYGLPIILLVFAPLWPLTLILQFAHWLANPPPDRGDE